MRTFATLLVSHENPFLRQPSLKAEKHGDPKNIRSTFHQRTFDPRDKLLKAVLPLPTDIQFKACLEKAWLAFALQLFS